MKTNYCPTCGHRMTPRKETLSRGLINTFVVFVDAIKRKGVNSVHLQKELNLSKNQYNNFQKLRYHGLVYHSKTKTGCWLLTRLGNRFVRGEISMPKVVYVQDNHIVYKGDKMLKIHELYKEGEQLKEEYWQQNFSLDIDQGRLF